MNKTLLPALLMVCALLPSAEASSPHHTAMLFAGRGDTAQAGLRIVLQDGWKTYWKMPGDSGVPPSFDWSSSDNVKAITVLYPAPARFADAGGETIGYKHEVVFPLRITPADDTKPMRLDLKLDFAVCRDVCMPVQDELQLDMNGNAQDDSLPGWEGKLPRAAAEADIQFKGIEQHGGKMSLRLATTQQAQDIFISSDSLAYFGQPQPAEINGEYLLPIANIKEPAKLKGKILDVVVIGTGAAYERSITLNW